MVSLIITYIWPEIVKIVLDIVPHDNHESVFMTTKIKLKLFVFSERIDPLDYNSDL